MDWGGAACEIRLGCLDEVGDDVVDHPADDLVHEPPFSEAWVLAGDDVVLATKQAHVHQIADFD